MGWIIALIVALVVVAVVWYLYTGGSTGTIGSPSVATAPGNTSGLNAINLFPTF